MVGGQAQWSGFLREGLGVILGGAVPTTSLGWWILEGWGGEDLVAGPRKEPVGIFLWAQIPLGIWTGFRQLLSTFYFIFIVVKTLTMRSTLFNFICPI